VTPLRRSKRRAVKEEPGRAASRRLADLVVGSLDDDKADDIVVVDLAGKSDIADYMVIASGTSQRHVSSMAEHLTVKLKPEVPGGVPVEGAQRSDWVLIDGGDVIVHLFRPEVRRFYNLEKMWGTALSEMPLREGAAAERPAVGI
jgi:ribosome-associated protein